MPRSQDEVIHRKAMKGLSACSYYRKNPSRPVAESSVFKESCCFWTCWCAQFFDQNIAELFFAKLLRWRSWVYPTIGASKLKVKHYVTFSYTFDNEHYCKLNQLNRGVLVAQRTKKNFMSCACCVLVGIPWHSGWKIRQLSSDSINKRRLTPSSRALGSCTFPHTCLWLDPNLQLDQVRCNGVCKRQVFPRFAYLFANSAETRRFS